jgi:hypothetical protein
MVKVKGHGEGKGKCKGHGEGNGKGKGHGEGKGKGKGHGEGNGKGKGKFVLVHTMEIYMGCGVQFHSFLVSAVDKGQWSASRCTCFTT